MFRRHLIWWRGLTARSWDFHSYGSGQVSADTDVLMCSPIGTAKAIIVPVVLFPCQEVLRALCRTIDLEGQDGLPDPVQCLRLFLYHHFYHQSRVSVAGGAPESATTGAGWHGSGNHLVLDTGAHRGTG